MAKFEKLNALKERMTELQEQMKKEGEAALKDSLKEFFEAFPEVEAITWAQYIPGFNDGDPCTFSLRETTFKPTAEGAVALGIAEDAEGEDEDYDDFLDSYALYEYKSNGREYNNDRAKELDDFLTEFDNFLGSIEDVLEAVFDYNVRIIATKEKVTTEDYDCGY